MRTMFISINPGKIKPGSLRCPERMHHMTREVYARFSDIDQAEAAVRALRQHCGGIHAFQIRRRPRLRNGESDLLPTAAFAMFNAFTDISSNTAAIPAAMIPPRFWDEKQVTDREMDGPAGREDCLLEIVIDREYAARAEAMLRAQHGFEVFQTGKDLVR